MPVIKRDTSELQFNILTGFMEGLGYTAKKTNSGRIVFVATIKECGAFRVIPLTSAVAIYNRAGEFKPTHAVGRVMMSTCTVFGKPNAAAAKYAFPSYLMGNVTAGRPISRVSVRQTKSGEVVVDQHWVHFINHSEGLIYPHLYHFPALEVLEE